MEKLTYIDTFNIIVKYLQQNIGEIVQRRYTNCNNDKIGNEFGLEEVFPETFKINAPNYINYNTIIDAITTLCRMGVVRKSTGPITTSGNNIGAIKGFYLPYRYALTEQGITWINKINSENLDFIYTSPHHFSEILDSFTSMFGDGFIQAAKEACSCYVSTCYLACCVMVGLSAEIVFIKANEIINNIKIDKDKHLRMWKLKDNISNALKNNTDKNKLDSFSNLIIDYRNDNAHGFNKKADEFVAYDSLSRLIRLCRFMDEKWIELNISGQTN